MSSLESHLPALIEPPIEYRPELRWWLAEGLHTDDTLRREIESAHRLGFGGMEFLAMDEGNIDHTRYGWGSEEWVHDSVIVVEETTRRNMSVSFTSGTNWSNANLPTIDPDHPAAAQELNYITEDVPAGSLREGPLPKIDLNEDRTAGAVPGHRVAPTQQTLVAALAVPILGDNVIDSLRVIDLTGQVSDEALEWAAPDDGSWRLFVFWSHGTGQTASPSATVNYTVNYLERDGVDAVVAYWRDVVLTPELKRYIADNPRTQMYMDSLELSTWGLGGMFWGQSVAAEFAARRGYDITPWLPFLVRTAGLMAAATTYHFEPDEDHRVHVEKVRFDYVRTLTDLYIENMLRPFAEFLHANGILLRAEISYGLPFELTRPGPEVDGIETESLEFGSQIDGYRLLAGPAHLFGKLYSSETGATTRNHMLEHRFFDQIIATQFAAGITKTVLHGWSSVSGAEGATEWPGHEGMWSMFSERFDTRQPASEFYPLWNAAMGRFQYLLRQGRPRVDVGILRTDHFVDNMSGMTLVDAEGKRVADEEAYATWWMRNRQNHWWQDLGMQDAGWTYDFLDGDLLLHPDVRFGEGVVQPDGPGYQALIVYQDALDADVARQLLAWAEQGLKVLIVNGARELKLLAANSYAVHDAAAVRTPGLDGRDAELASTMAALRALPSVAEVDDASQTLEALRELGVSGRAEFGAPNPNVLTCLREDGDLVIAYAYHFLYENGASTEVELTLPGVGMVHRVDPWTGTTRPHDGVQQSAEGTNVRLSLSPGETALLILDRSEDGHPTSPDDVSEVAELTTWQINVESWDAGDPEVISEDRGLGYTTREVLPTTAVTRLESPTGTLAPWTDLDGVGPEVSGVAEYRASFTLTDPDLQGSRYVLDLGSTNGGLGAVTVNGSARKGFDTSHPCVDITETVRPGRNEVVVRVSSSLNNRLLARGYYDDIPDALGMITGEPAMQQARVRDYGLTGPVRVLRSGGSRS